MTRYVAFLRGVSPQNAKMPALKACFEAAGFEHVRTILGSGNVAFDARTFLRRPAESVRLAIGRDGATILAWRIAKSSPPICRATRGRCS